MSLRENLLKSYKKGGLSDGEVRPPSRAYERYFEGYTESAEPVPDRKRAKAVRTYIADFYIQELPEKKRLCFRILFAVLYVLAWPPLVISAVQDISANKVWYVTLPQAAAVFSLGWMAVGLFHYCTVPREMTVRQYREGVTRFHQALYPSFLSLAVLSLSYLIHSIAEPDGRAGTLLGALLCCISFACILAVFFAERGVRYTERGNPLARESDEA
ncbi:MAG: hypothetical protein ACI4O3_03590 [Oscillospiraceae bacterium]